MNYHGYEIYFQTLGNADSIFVRCHTQGVKTNVLIDGGRKTHADAVRSFLRGRGESEIHHLVCSHHHADHAGGLIQLVEDKTLTIHRAWVNTAEIMADRADLGAYAARGYGKLVETLRASKQTQTELIGAINKRGITLSVPWSGQAIGPLIVLSPTPDFYQQQLDKIKQESLAKALNDRYLRKQLKDMFEVTFGNQVLYGKQASEDEEESGELGADPTSPENEVATVLCLPWTTADNTKRYDLLTADAGTEALKSIMTISEAGNHFLKGLSWMQLPHHGSRRNLTEAILDYFKPKVSFVSAEGGPKHPSKQLINAVNVRNGEVYSTHYPDKAEAKGSWLRHHHGTVPDVGTVPATPLWKANKAK